jgi:hypothetical protein
VPVAEMDWHAAIALAEGTVAAVWVRESDIARTLSKKWQRLTPILDDFFEHRKIDMLARDAYLNTENI